jgi:hypothetical protein
VLTKCAVTALNSKLISGSKDFFANIVVDAILQIDGDLDLDRVGIKRCPGGSSLDSFLVNGVAFKKTFAYAGFEQQPKSFDNPKIALLNVELELKAEGVNAEVRSAFIHSCCIVTLRTRSRSCCNVSLYTSHHTSHVPFNHCRFASPTRTRISPSLTQSGASSTKSWRRLSRPAQRLFSPST